MRPTLRSRLLLIPLLLYGWLTCSPAAAGPELTLASLAKAREAAVRDRNLSDTEKKQVLELFDAAAKSVESALLFRAQKIGQERRREAVLRERTALSDELLRAPQAANQPDNPDETVASVGEALDRAFVERNAHVRILNDLNHPSTDLGKRRDEITHRRGQLRQEEEGVGNELAAMQIQFGSTAWESAVKARAAARIQVIEAERDALVAESAALDALRALVPLQRDEAKIKLEAAERAIETLKARSRKAQMRDARRDLDRALQAAAWAPEESPSLQSAARQVAELAHRLWSEQGIVLRKQELESVTERMRRETLRVESSDASMRRRYEAGERFTPAVEWLQGLPQDLPRLSSLIGERQEKLAALAQLRRDTLGLEDRLQGDQSLEVQMEQIRREWAGRGGPPSPDAIVQARQLLQLRRDLIEDTLKGSQDLDAEITEYSRVSAALIGRLEGMRDFAQQRVLWSPSTIEPFSFARSAQAAAWLAWNRDWTRIWPASAHTTALVLAACSLLAGFLLLRRGGRAGAARLLVEAGIPLLLLWASWAVAAEPSGLGRAVKGGLSGAAALAAIALALREAVRQGGFLARLFGWPELVRARIARDLAWLPAVLPAAWAVVRGLADAGHLMSGSTALQAFHGSLGRLCFVAMCALLSAVALRIFAPGGPVAEELRRRRESAPPTLLRADRVFCTAPILLPALLAVAGFYASALVLAINLLYTALLTGLLITVSALLRRRLVRIPEEGANNGTPAQVRRLAHFFLTLVWAAGTLVIWSGVFPALTMLGEVRLPGSASLTLLTLLEALLTTAGFVILVRNVPGVLDFLFVQRLRLHGGTVYALATISRYVLVFLGLLVVSRILGVNWSQVQWLAAALTFGIGFGLQEVFANLASGVILLLDRSIRVGDAVTIGEWSGRVSRIQMRATTVTLWNRSEMVVPNKEFISGKLINWTLSLPESRVDLKVGVAYGSDLELVREILHGAAAANENVLAAPPPQVLLTAFSECAILFELQTFCLYEFGRQTLLDQLHTAVYREFAHHGIRIASPRLDVHLLKEST